MTWPPRSFTNWSPWKRSISLGNDLVWLKDPANQGRHADLLLVRRVLTPKERLLVQVSSDPDRMLWSLWAAKEAAFKAFSRQFPRMVFSPIRIEVDPGVAGASPTVHWDGHSLPVLWQQGQDWVHALVSPDSAAVVVKIQRGAAEADESVAVRQLAAQTLMELGAGPGTIEGLPPLFVRPDMAPLIVSLSHDGPWLAVAVPR